MTARVSICIPTYNRKNYLKETLASVFAQTYKDHEVVVLDDGSTDGTGEMIKKAAYPNLRYYWQENAGLSAARNKLIDLSQAEFITFIDSDDLLMPDAVERMIKVMEAEGGDSIVYGPYLRIDENGNVFGKCERKLYSGFITTQLFENILVHSCGSMFPRRILQEAGGFDESLKVSMDYDLWLRLSLKYRFVAIREPTFKRRRHCTNLSAASAENVMTELRILERFYYERGGKNIISEKIAARRLSRGQYRVGKHLLKEKRFGEAIRYFRESFSKNPNPKALLMWGFAVLRHPGGR